MEQWLKRVGIVLLVIFGLLYVGAKIHFFTRYGVVSPGDYGEEHWPFWAGMAIISGAVACLGWMIKRRDRSKSN